jgi:hypothetical protein
MTGYTHKKVVEVDIENDESKLQALVCMLLIFGFVMILPLAGINIYEIIPNIGVAINHAFGETVNFISQLSIFLHLDDLAYQISQLF